MSSMMSAILDSLLFLLEGLRSPLGTLTIFSIVMVLVLKYL